MKELLQEWLEMFPAPNPNCSCHLAAPCSDCVENGALRDLIERTKAAIAEKVVTKWFSYCRDCGGRIEKKGDIWEHVGVSVRHPAIPGGPRPEDQVQYRSATSGLWYNKPGAAGSIIAIRFRGRTFAVGQKVQIIRDLVFFPDSSVERCVPRGTTLVIDGASGNGLHPIGVHLESDRHFQFSVSFNDIE